MDVDEDEEDGDEQGHPARDDLGVHQKAEKKCCLIMMMVVVVVVMMVMMTVMMVVVIMMFMDLLTSSQASKLLLFKIMTFSINSKLHKERSFLFPLNMKL